MTAYYNEIDPYAAQWLRNLQTAGLIPAGDVDERSIADVRADDLKGYTQCHFFAGIGGWLLALRLAGWPEDRPVWTGSCPCQPFSAAGRRKGFDDRRHLWPEFRRLISERRPAVVFGEQVASATEWLRLVRGDLEAMEYAVGAMPIEAASAGADHLRDRFWFVANGRYSAGAPSQPSARGEAKGRRQEDPDTAKRDSVLANANEPERRFSDKQPARQQSQPEQDTRARAVDDGSGEREHGSEDPARASGRRCAEDASIEWIVGADGKARRVKSGIRLLADGFPSRMGLLRGFGNAIDPRPAATFIATASECLTHSW